MDIVNRKKQHAQITLAAQQRHRERVRAGEEVLGLRTTPPKHHYRRTLLAIVAALCVFVIGAFLYIGAKAYFATAQMRIQTFAPAYTTAPPTETPSTTGPSRHRETITIQKDDPAPNELAQKSFLRDSLSAASSLVGKRTPLRGEKNGAINILLLGKGTPDHPGRDLTDTIMIARIDVRRGKVALLSLPRDLYVRIPGTQSATKINALYRYGLEHNRGATPIIAAVETITQLPIHYFLVADFDAFTAVVDALGGINVTVERPINDTRYPGPGYSYETFTLAPGLQRLDGATALKYVRTRHGDPEGDFGRAKRQQHVLQAIKNKAFSIGTLSNPLTIGKLFDAMGAHIRTDMDLTTLTSLVALLPQLDTQNITTVVIDAWKANSLLRVIHVGKMFALVPRAGRFDYTEIAATAQAIFDRPAQERLRTEVAREHPTITLIRAGATKATLTRVRTLIANALAIDQRAIRIAPRTITPTKAHAAVIDYTESAKPFTFTALLRTLGATAHQDNLMRSPTTDFAIVLGADADAFFRESAISKEQFETADLSRGNDVMILQER